MGNERTSIQLTKETRDRLKELKPYPSVSFDDLLQDMADHFENVDPTVKSPYIDEETKKTLRENLDEPLDDPQHLNPER